MPSGNTAKVLLAVLPGMRSEIGRYADLKEKCKKNSTNLYLDEYKILSAEISTKLQIGYESSWSDLHELEKESYLKDKSVMVSSERCNELKRLLSLYEKLKRHFGLQGIYFNS